MNIRTIRRPPPLTDLDEGQDLEVARSPGEEKQGDSREA
jgi:hypothetical protein